MPYSEVKVLKILGQIKDPETGRDIVSAGLLGDLSYEGGLLRVILQIDPSKAKTYETLRGSIEHELLALNGIDKAAVLLTAHKDAPKLERKAAKKPVNPHQARRPEGYQGDANVAKVIAVSSAKGGVGKSTLAVNMAVALSKLGQRVGLLDADVHGPSAPILLGLQGKRAGTSKTDGRMLIEPFEAYGVKVMSMIVESLTIFLAQAAQRQKPRRWTLLF